MTGGRDARWYVSEERTVKKVAIRSEGRVEVHAEGIGNYATLCGLDGDDSAVGQEPAEVPPGARIDCATCRQVWDLCRGFRRVDFV
jgi:hypothetical protein